ncbi:MAG: NUDIX hydrolase [Lachnospiraceae bacterium]
MADQFERIDRKLVYQGHIVDFYEDTVKVPNGNVVKWDFIKHKGAAAVVPVLDDGRILMVKQYRNALDRETLEIPAGGLNEADEPFVECSHRELEEETGYKCELSDMDFLISIRSTVAFCDERIDVYVAKNLVKSSQNLDEDEFINVCPCTTEELSRMIYEGEIQDSKTIASVMAYIHKYER